MGASTLCDKHKLRNFIACGVGSIDSYLESWPAGRRLLTNFHSKMNLSYSSVVGFLLLTKLLQTFQNLETCFINPTNVRTPFLCHPGLGNDWSSLGSPSVA
jgi:hypothetical protein